MELQEYISIFKKYKKHFLFTVLLFFLIGITMFILQPVQYENNVMLNVTRKGTQQTSEYRYDDFYRLQADERFADTVVRWLGSPQISNEILKDAGVENATVEFKAQRLSSQMIQLTYKTNSENTGKKIASSATQILNSQTDELNKDQKEETWFKIIGSDSSVSLSKTSFTVIILASLMLGVFFGAWVVLFKHYFSK